MAVTSPITIYNASAGSGKTYSLVKSYIATLLQSKFKNKHRHLLAITFTNKAVSEMKERVLQTLQDFAFYKDRGERIPTMLVDIASETGMDHEVLATQSSQLLSSILHNYAAFDIVTIDTLTHRILRTFSKDLGISGNFEVSLDVKNLLSRAVDRVIDKTGTDKKITEVLVNYALEKADDDKDWNITRDLNTIAYLLNQENDAAAMATLQDKTLDDFDNLSKILSKKRAAVSAQLKKEATGLLEKFAALGIEDNHFSRKTFYNHVYKLSQDPALIKFDPKSTWQNDIDNYSFYNKTTDESAKSSIDNIRDELITFFKHTKNLYYKAHKYREFQKRIVPLSTLQLINKELQLLKEEENILLISDFNAIINKSLKDQPAAFIYERLGERYTNYFIDEFQDTSMVQWENLISLIDNAVVSASLDTTPNSLLLVGDPKQAIYRWRGGKAEQFIALTGGQVPFQSREAAVIQLDTNYRSHKEVIKFNNSFFTHVSQVFDDPVYSHIYSQDNKQLYTDKEGGYVSIGFIEAQTNDEADELYPPKVLEIINKAVQDGFEKSDICILIRNNKQGAHIAQYLSEQDVQVVSSDSLLLKNSDTVLFIHDILLLQEQPKDVTTAVRILSFIARRFEIQDTHLFLSSWLEAQETSLYQYLETLDIFFSPSSFNALPLYEGIEYIIRSFHLPDLSDAYVIGYLETVFKYTSTHHKGLIGFIHHWEEKKDNLSIDAPLQKEAVQIMTIHKSKGLEFPVVIFPYADSDLYTTNNEHHWYQVAQEEFGGFATLMAHHNTHLKNYGEQGEQLYTNRHSEQQFDNINVLYVALTRAVQRLYVLSRFRESVIPKNYSHLFMQYLQKSSLWVDGILEYTFGKPEHNKKEGEKLTDTTLIPFISSDKKDHNITVVTNNGLPVDPERQEAITEGNLIHQLLSLIYTPTDIERALHNFILDGFIVKDDYERYKNLLIQVMQHPDLQEYFKETATIYNERAILSKDGAVFIPDRVVVTPEGDTTILDYKTGIPKEEHSYQLDLYATLLREMNFKVVGKILIYIENEITVLKL